MDAKIPPGVVMPRDEDSTSGAEAIDRIIDDVLDRRHFCVSGLGLEWAPRVDEEMCWEVFRGRLLDPAHTRERRRFLSWNVFQTVETGGHSPEPLLSVKLD